MQKPILPIAVVFILCQATTFSQPGSPPLAAIDITSADVQAVASLGPGDRQIRVVDMGKYNLGVGVVHQRARKPGAPVTGSFHSHITENYIIISGSGTLVTGGTVVDPKPNSQSVNGPTVSGGNQGGYHRKVTVGDVIIIPPGVVHGWADIEDHVTYLSVRPDPDRVLPAGYVNPALKK